MEQGRALRIRLGEGGVIIKEDLLQLLFPPRCPVCDGILEAELIRAGELVHPLCEERLYPVGDDYCLQCGKPLQQAEREYCFDCRKKLDNRQVFHCKQGRAVYVYRGDIRKTMYRFKYSNRREYARFFAEKAAQQYAGWIRRCGVEAVVPVPMYARKKRRRGYNQAEVFGRELARFLGIAFEPKGVRRVTNTRPQKLLSAQERKKNLEKAFQAAEFIVNYKCVLVVDDIYTTGSTVETVAEVMRRSGVENVYFLTLCTGEGV